MKPIYLILPKAPMRGRLLMKGQTWRAQHFKKKREQGEWQLLIRTAMRGQMPKKPLSGVEINITVYRLSPDRDSDNALYALKPILDALKDERVIFDDSERHVAINLKQIKTYVAEEERTEMVIRRRDKNG